MSFYRFVLTVLVKFFICSFLFIILSGNKKNDTKSSTTKTSNSSTTIKKKSTTNSPTNVLNNNKNQQKSDDSINKKDSLSSKNNVIAKYQKQLSHDNDLTLFWQQKQYKSLRKRFTTTSGKGFFKRPNQFVWQMQTINQSWVYNGSILYHIEHTDKQAIKYNLSQDRGIDFKRFINLITKFSELSKEYNIQSSQKTDNILSLHLVPKTSADLQLVKVKYDIAKKNIDEIRMNFYGGNYTLINFSNHTKKPLSSSIFTVPKGYNVQVIK